LLPCKKKRKLDENQIITNSIFNVDYMEMMSIFFVFAPVIELLDMENLDTLKIFGLADELL
jgi:hypothetical protein